MTVCPVCGHLVIGDDGMCGFHTATLRGDWATGNRIMCDFVHRHIVHADAELPVFDTLDQFVGERAA